MRALVIPFLAAAAPALAEPCVNATAVPAAPRALVAQAAGMGVGSLPDATLLFALPPGTKLNASAGLAVTFRDGRECLAAISGGDAAALRLGIPARDIAAVEGGVCHAADGSCVPARVELPR